MERRYAQVRAQTLTLVAPLSEADCQAQSMPDASPTKWHLAHVTWFFETFVLERFEPGFQSFHPAFRTLFNSDYQGVGEQHPRPQRGLITRPDLADIKTYRANVVTRIAALLSRTDTPEPRELMELGLQHEQQHQELLLTDIKHLLAMNPLSSVVATPMDWVEHAGGIAQVENAPRRAAAALCPGQPARDARRLAGFHGRRWLPQPALVDGGGLGPGASPTRRSAALLASQRRRLDQLHAARPRAAGLAHARCR